MTFRLQRNSFFYGVNIEGKLSMSIWQENVHYFVKESFIKEVRGNPDFFLIGPWDKKGQKSPDPFWSPNLLHIKFTTAPNHRPLIPSFINDSKASRKNLVPAQCYLASQFPAKKVLFLNVSFKKPLKMLWFSLLTNEKGRKLPHEDNAYNFQSILQIKKFPKNPHQAQAN